MTMMSYPGDDDRRALAAAHELLDAQGVAPAPHGYDVSTLAAAVYAHGWTYGIDLVSGSYRAEIRPQGARTQQPSVVGVGWTPEAALAFALARALPRDAASTGRLRLRDQPQEATTTE